MNAKNRLTEACSSLISIRCWSKHLCILLLLSTLSGCRNEEISSDVSLQAFAQYLNVRIPTLMRYYNIPGANIAIIKKGRIVWMDAYGFADLEKGRKMAIGDYCRVESISKSVTAWGVMKLVDEGKIELDKPIVAYLKSWKLPDSRFSEDKITIRQLLSQSSGMPLGTIGVRYAPTEDKPSLREILSRDAVLFQEPGISFSYSNTGFILLELLIEEVTGQAFAAYMQKEVLLPLGMRNSSFVWNRDWSHQIPIGYNSAGKPIPAYVYPDKAAGGLFATVGDVAKFVSAGMPHFSMNGIDVLSTQSIDKLYTSMTDLSGYYQLVFDAYGLGHFIEFLPPTMMKSISHGGQGSGWMTHFQAVPKTGDGIVILTNSQRSWPFFAYVLTDWANWNGFSSIGMGKIVVWARVLWALTGVLFLMGFYQIGRLVKGIVSGTRRLAPFSKIDQVYRLGQTILFILISTGLWWMLSQDYFFLFSVFPIASNSMVVSIFVVASALLLSALFPVRVFKP